MTSLYFWIDVITDDMADCAKLTAFVRLSVGAAFSTSSVGAAMTRLMFMPIVKVIIGSTTAEADETKENEGDRQSSKLHGRKISTL